MATIGSFTKTDTGFSGAVKTLTLNVKATFRADDKENDKAPDFRIFAGATEFGAAMASASSDTTITTKIKAKYAIERDLSMFGISVNTTDGRVTLAGNVTSHQQIGKAMLIALETDGVREVNSTLQVKSPARPSS